MIALAILFATSSNNLLKAGSFSGGRATTQSAAALVLLAVGGLAIAMAIGNSWL